MDRGTWQAIVHRVAKSQTGLKHLSTSTSSPISKKAEPRVQSILDSERFPLLASRPKQWRHVWTIPRKIFERMYGCEGWTVKKAECRRIDAFELWCWRRLLRVPWTARRSNQSILKEISPGISLEGMMLKLKLQYFGHLLRRVDSLEKTHAGRDWGQAKKGSTEDEMAGWHHWLDGCESEWTPGDGDEQGGLVWCLSWGHKESDTTEWLNWTELKESLVF